MTYPAHHHLVDPARAGRNSIGHILAGIALIWVLGYLLSAMAFEAALTWANGRGFVDLRDDLFTGATPEAMYILLFSFGVWPIAIWAALRLVHQRGFAPVFGATLWPQFVNVTKALLVLNLALLLMPPWNFSLPDDMSIAANLPFGRWLLLLPVSLVAVMVQVGSEEVLFRGYLQQQLAARWRSPVVWMVLPSLLFGLGHYDSEAGANAWLLVLWAFVFGVLMADLTARAGSLGPAIAVHFVNNTLAMLLIGVPDSLDGLALYSYPVGLEDEMLIRSLLPIDFMVMFVSWLTARLVLRR